MVVTIASTHCAYPRMDGQAELAWVAGYAVRQFTCPKAVTHPAVTLWSRSALKGVDKEFEHSLDINKGFSFIYVYTL